MAAGEKAQGYELFILALCLYALAALAVNALAPLDLGTRQLLNYIDTGVCLLFFIDFWVSLVRAQNRWRYLYTWGWLDLLSSIPMVDALRWGRAARIIRIVRVLRGMRATKILAEFVLVRRAESAGLTVALMALLLVVFSSIAILQFEASADGNIKSAEDALWWALVTITTVGYGDRYPVTLEGRAVAVLLMIAGVGLFGTLSGFVASWFIAPGSRQQESEIEGLRQEVRALRMSLEEKR